MFARKKNPVHKIQKFMGNKRPDSEEYLKDPDGPPYLKDQNTEPNSPTSTSSSSDAPGSCEGLAGAFEGPDRPISESEAQKLSPALDGRGAAGLAAAAESACAAAPATGPTPAEPTAERAPEQESGLQPEQSADASAAGASLCRCGTRRTRWAGCPIHKVCTEFRKRADSGDCVCGFPEDEHSVCKEYRINLDGVNFGDCKCGFAKAMHEPEAFSGRSTSRKSEEELLAGFVCKESVECTHYRVNLQSANFGECMCGMPRAAHSEEALTESLEENSGSRKSEEELLAGFKRKTSVQCTHYRVNLQSANFGECMCGMPKADHSEEALKENSENRATAMTTRRDEVELRKTFVQREKVECAKYEVDMSPGALYGMCICGKPRAEHTEEALQGSKHEAKGRRSEAEVRAQMAARAAAAEVASAPMASAVVQSPRTPAAASSAEAEDVDDGSSESGTPSDTGGEGKKGRRSKLLSGAKGAMSGAKKGAGKLLRSGRKGKAGEDQDGGGRLL